VEGQGQFAALDPVPLEDDEEVEDDEVEVEDAVEEEAAGAAELSFELDDEALSTELAVLRLSVR
jgi:hypothetical protein